MADELDKAVRKSIDQTLAAKHEKETCHFKIEVSEKKKTVLYLYLITEFRVFLFKENGKFVHESHLLELEEISSNSPQEVSVKFKAWNVVANTKFVNEIILHTYLAYIAKFPLDPENRFALNVTPPSRLEEVFKDAKAVIGPCGGFVDTYGALCNYLNNPVYQDFAWDVQNIWPAIGVRELNLTEFRKDSITVLDLKGLLDALKHNKWFAGLRIQNIRLGADGLAIVTDCLRTNTTLKTVNLRRVMASKEAFIALAGALAENKKLALTSIDISQNSLEDKGGIAWGGLLDRFVAPLARLDVSSCQMEKKGLSALLKALENCSLVLNNLKFLDISNNSLGVEGSEALSNFLGKTTVLTELYIACTNPNFHALKKCQPLTKLDFSGNKISNKENLHLDLVRFLRFSTNLQCLNLSNTMLHPDTFSDFFSEKPLCDLVELDMSHNELGDTGMTSLCKVLLTMQNLVSLNIEGNYLSSKTRPKSRVEAIEGLINLVNNDKSKLTTLKMGGNNRAPLRTDIAPFLFDLINNDTLTDLDISGHEMGELGIVALCKLLQVNDTITKLTFDQNAISLLGLRNFKIALARNKALTFCPVPASDIANLLKTGDAPAQASVLQIAQEISELLYSHASPAPVAANAPPPAPPADQDPLLKALAATLLPKAPKPDPAPPTNPAPAPAPTATAAAPNPFNNKGLHQARMTGKAAGINTKSANALFGELRNFINENPTDEVVTNTGGAPPTSS